MRAFNALPASSMLRILILFVLLAVAACGRAGHEEPPVQPAPSETKSAFRNVQQKTAYVGDQACFDCHEDLWRGYQTHGMARSYYPLTPENAVERIPGGPIRHEATDFYYRVYEENGRFIQEEYRLDAAGRKTHRLVRAMDYVVGSGNAARTYLTEQNGRLYELPLTWYTQAEKWDFSPGYRERNGRFDRLIPDGCMACHNDYPTTVPFVKGKYTEVPDGIGCERCHGPGALHVEERLAVPEPADEVDRTIVNPAHLPLDRELDVCQQCHLHGSVEVPREGKDAFDFRPSEPLSAHIALFSRVERQGSGEKISVISHADRMKQSACFRAVVATDRPMTCVTCHDPHTGFREKGRAYFNETCMDCHAVEALRTRLPAAARVTHTAESDCFGCHMPKVEVEDAPHASFTDHWIRVVGRDDGPDPLAAHTPGDLVPYFDRDRSGSEAQRYKGMALVKLGSQRSDTMDISRGLTLLETALAEQPDHPEAQLLRGLGHMMLGRPERAIPAFEQAVRLDPDNPEYLYGLADAYQKAGRDADVIIRLYERALSIQPALANTRVNYGRFLESVGRLDDAIQQYRLAAEEQPWLAEAHYDLGTAYLQKQQLAEAEAELLRALELEPDYPDALGNLALLYVNQGHKEKARDQFERAVAVAPADPTSLGNLGTFYLNEGQYDRAIELLERAVEINPRYLNGLINLSLAYFRDDDLDRARHYAQEALEIDPQNDKARQLYEASL